MCLWLSVSLDVCLVVCLFLDACLVASTCNSPFGWGALARAQPPRRLRRRCPAPSQCLLFQRYLFGESVWMRWVGVCIMVGRLQVIIERAGLS